MKLSVKDILRFALLPCYRRIFFLPQRILCSWYLTLLFQNQHRLILLPPLFKRISQSRGQAQQNGK